MAAPIKLTKQQQQMLIVGAVLLIGGGYAYFAFFWIPVAKRIGEVGKQIEEVEAKIEKALRQASRLPRLEAELAELNEKALEAERRLPKKKSTPEILVTVSDVAEKHRVILMSFSPGAQSAKQFFIELKYPMVVKGSFHNIGRFLAGLALEERIFNVESVMYSEPAGDAGEMTVNFTLISYQYKG